VTQSDTGEPLIQPRVALPRDLCLADAGRIRTDPTSCSRIASRACLCLADPGRVRNCTSIARHSVESRLLLASLGRPINGREGIRSVGQPAVADFACAGRGSRRGVWRVSRCPLETL
jgi:hypothetical protein